MNTETNSNIISTYEKVFIITKRYAILILAAIFGLLWYYIIQNINHNNIVTHDNNIISWDNNVTNPFILNSEWWVILPISSQIWSTVSDSFDAQSFVNKYIYTNNLSGFDQYSNFISWNINRQSITSIAWNDIVKHFNLSCLLDTNIVDFSTNTACQKNVDFFVNNFWKYNIDSDLFGLQKIVNKLSSWSDNNNLICQNILKYIYTQNKIYPVFDEMMSKCTWQNDTYNQIVDLKKLLENKNTWTENQYRTIAINDLKTLSWMQYIYNILSTKPIQLPEIKKYLNWIGKQPYNRTQESIKQQAIIYIFNNKIYTELQNYQSQNQLSVADGDYTQNMLNDINQSSNSLDNEAREFAIWSNNINNPEIVNTNTWDTETTNTGNIITNDEDIIKNLIVKYLNAEIIDHQSAWDNQYIYKVNIDNTSRWLYIIKVDWWRSLKTLYIHKSNGEYSKVNDFSVLFDDSEEERFDVFASKKDEIYNKLK